MAIIMLNPEEIKVKAFEESNLFNQALNTNHSRPKWVVNTIQW
jgi:hypothetical protein